MEELDGLETRREEGEEGGEAAAQRKRRMSREGRRGEEETPGGRQRVLSDRLGLCNRMGAF